MKTYVGILSVIAVCFTLVNCEGPAGPQGDPGPQGEQGPAGSDGSNASTNMQSETVTLNSLDFSELDNYEIYVTYEWDAMTSDVVDTGVVLGYLKYNDDEWFLLPYIDTIIVDDALNFTISYATGEFTFRVIAEEGGNNAANAAEVHGKDLKIVVFPPEEMSQSKSVISDDEMEFIFEKYGMQ